ncbi:MAG TPA: prolyl oligopeptidase family serine peptidase [Solimonas sp.]
MKPDYPQTDIEPQTVTFGSVTLSDPYAWLEEESARAVEWQARQDALATNHVRSLPQYAPLLAQNLAYAAASRLGSFTPTYAGGRWFRHWMPDDQDCDVLEVGAGPISPGRRILDFNQGTHAEPRKIEAMAPSPDGHKIIVTWGEGGREQQYFQVLDVDTGALLLDGVPQLRPQWTAWLPDSSGFYYMAYDPALSATAGRIYLQRLGQPAPTQPEDLELTHPVAIPRTSADGRHMLLFADHLNRRPDYIRDTTADGPWRPFLKGVPHSFRGDIIGDRFIALTNEDAATGRVVSIPLATATDRGTWRELLPASANVLASLVVVGSRYVLVDLVDTYSRVRVFNAEGVLEWELPLPEPGTVNQFAGPYLLYNMVDCVAAGGADEIVFVFSSLRTSPALFRADLARRQLEPLTQPHTRIDAVVQDFATTSKDGARVPYRLVARRDVDLSRPQPSIVFGYGGFSAAVVPGWTPFSAWIRNGGVLVVAHLRGGGEFGPDWWHQGRLRHKQNTFNDVNAVAEDLIRRGLTTPAQLGVQGGSNGGTMAAAAAVQRPDLYRASAPQVPQTDVLARVRDPISVTATLDYGDPLDPEMSQVLHAWSPYHGVREDVAYPAFFIDCGLNDPRCPPWHGRKLAARLQHASASERPVLLRVRAGAGHGPVGKQAAAEQNAEILAFFAAELALPIHG